MNRQKNSKSQKPSLTYEQRQTRRNQIIIVAFSGFLILSMILSLFR